MWVGAHQGFGGGEDVTDVAHGLLVPLAHGLGVVIEALLDEGGLRAREGGEQGFSWPVARRSRHQIGQPRLVKPRLLNLSLWKAPTAPPGSAHQP